MITGCMQQHNFNLISILQHAARWRKNQEVVTNTVEGGIHRITYGQLYARSGQLAHALTALGVKSGERIGTMAWNTWRHLECWYAIGGLGAVCHTLNPRLFPDQIDYIVNHAEDRFIFVDISFVSVLENVLDRLPNVEALVVLTDEAHMPDISGFNIPVYCYESLIAGHPEEYDWPELTEDTASSLCYTSGTTGNPKGVLYSHRSNIIHAMCSVGADVFAITSDSVSLMVVPMFHANSWGLAFSVPMVGAKLVLPGPHMDGPSVAKIINDEKVTMSAAVPTVWTGLLNHLDEVSGSVPSLKETMIGGSAAPRAMIEKFKSGYGVDVIHVWGMTELSPLGAINRPVPDMAGFDESVLSLMRAKQGRAPYGIEMRIVDEDNNDLPHDGKSFGRLLVRGPWVIERYFRAERTALDVDGWLDTGDVAHIDALGFMQITDRSKDLIKSGGEWISSVDIENTALGHPDLDIAACIGVSHPKWEERPLLVAVIKKDCSVSIDEIRAHIATEHAKWQVPDDVVFIDEMPLTATGKIDKKPLRKRFADHYEKPSAS